MMVDLKKRENEVLLAVSGGADSMVLLHLFAANYKGRFRVATVNHNIRENAQSDCLFVKNYCGKAGVECAVLNVDAPLYAKEKKLSLETAARFLRHQALKKEAAGAVIVTAHHQNDQAETVLLHLLRGSGAKGLCGMEKDEDGYWRPLLDVSKEDILDYARRNKIDFVEDETNADDVYARNFLRNKVFPLLKQINGNAVENIARCSSLISQDETFMENVAGVVMAKTPLIFDGQKVFIPLEIFTLNPALTSRVVFSALAEVGAQKDIEQRHIDDICLLAGKKRGKEIHLPFNLTALKDYGGVAIFFRQDCVEKSGVENPPLSLNELKCEAKFSVGEHKLGQKTVVISKEGEGLRFDIDKVPKDALLRFRREGDYFTKFGGGTKSLSGYLSDKKIKKEERDSLVLLAQDKEVLAIVGVEISQKLKVTENSKEYKIYCKEIK